MARKTTAKTAAAATAEANGMDYPQHEAMWNAFTAMVTWSIVGLLFILVALYCFIIAGQPILGTVLLLALPAGAVWLFVTRSRPAS